MSDKSLQTDLDSTLPGPGRLLREGREKLGLSQKEIASQLNLQTDMIDAVENDAKDRLPAATYVRGYIRNYAKIVNLNAEELIKLYENDADAPPEIVPDTKSHTQVSSTDKPVKAVTYLITFSLVLLLIAWLQSHYVVNKETASADTPATETMEQYQELPEYSASDSSYANTPVIEEDFVEKPSNNPGLSIATQVALPEISENIGTLELPATTDTETPGNITEAGPDIDETETLLPAGDEIEFRLTRNSWIEVYDSGNQKLYMGLAKQGEELKVSGVAPFDVLLGYSPGVEVRFNGELFDTKPYSRSGIARFKLGENIDQEHVE